MKVERCKPPCTFNWEECYEILDTAITHMVQEKLITVHKTSISDLMAYVLAKEEAQKQQEDLGE
jgi:hypothetical protein